MTREIKFRSWVNDHWVDWIPTCQTLGAYNASIIDTDGYTFEEDNPFIVEQYTGLKDKNGKEIYEGDIVRKYSDGDIVPICGVVEFYKNGARFCVNPGYNMLTQRWEVIGNIHENSELLEGENDH